MRLIGLAVVLALTFILSPLTAEAQQAAKIPRIGYLMVDRQPFATLHVGSTLSDALRLGTSSPGRTAAASTCTTAAEARYGN